jgi:hypothetical protein
MGANFQDYTLPGNKTIADVQQWFKQEQERCRDEYGSDPYNGTFSTVRGISFPNLSVFATVRAAQEWLADNTDKWECAKAVKVRNVVTKPKIRPTFDGKPQNGWGAEWKSFLYIRHSTAPIFVPADQLSDTKKGKLQKLWEAYLLACEQHAEVKKVYDPLFYALQNMDADFNDYRGLKAARTKLQKATAQAQGRSQGIRRRTS